jgi:outer membrane protein insertion porin family
MEPARTLNLIVLTSIVLSSLSGAYAQTDVPEEQLTELVIGSIEIVGAIRISKTKILSEIRSREGDLFDPDKARKDSNRIAKLPGVEYSYYNTAVISGPAETIDGIWSADRKVRLTFVVGERNVIQTLEFVGNHEFKDKRLRHIIGMKQGEHVDVISAEAGALSLTEYYLKKGFAFVKVTLVRERLVEGKLIYRIDEGPRVRIKRVMFMGNKVIKTSSLRNVVKTQPRSWIFLPSYYIEEKVAEDVEKLKAAYLRKGFLGANVSVRKDFSEDKSGIDVTFVIYEGPVYAVDKITLKGAEKIYGLDEDFGERQLRAKLKSETGQIFSERRARSDAGRLLKFYREHGFIDAKVGQARKFVSIGKVDVEFGIVEGDQFRIGRIDIVGNEQTQDKVIRRVLDEYEFAPGQWYNADLARGDGSGDLEKKVRRMALTESATISTKGDMPGRRDAEVAIEEGKTGMWFLSAAVSSDSGVMGGVMLEQRNFDISNWPKNFDDFFSGNAFKGAGQTLRISIQPGTEISQSIVSFTEPYFQGKPISMDTSGSSWGRERESFDEGRLKGYFGLSERYEQRYKDLWRRRIGFRIEDVDVGSIDANAPKEIYDVKGGNVLVGVRLGIGKDFTNDKFLPSQGYHVNGSYEQVTGDHTFGILEGTYRKYTTIYEDLAERKVILATKLHAGTVIGDAPPFEKYYAGGMHSIRGFDYRGVSTRGTPTLNGVPIAGAEKDDPIGSDWIFLANGEVVAPLVGESLSLLFFVDSGTIDSGGYRGAVGTGIQIMIPQWFGPVPMRFELGVPFLKDDDDETETFSFSVGRLF